MDGDRFTEGLDPAQALAVTTDAAPLCVLAPAGSGKTRVLTNRIARRSADGSADARHVLALTFTRRAAGELQRRLARLGLRDRPTAGTFHAVAWSLLRTRWADERLAPPELVTARGRLVAEVLDEGQGARRRLPAPAVAGEIDWARARLVTPERYEEEAARADRRPGVPLGAVAQAFASYEARKRARRLVDFDDLLAHCTRDLERHRTWAEAVHWRFRHLFVDEYQDVNPLQHALLEAWRAGRPDLCVVGDPNQAIYGWNGADAAWLVRFQDHHPSAGVVHLRRSYRSTPAILAAAAEVLRAGGLGTPDTEPVRPAGDRPEVAAFADDAGEAAGIAAWLRTARAPNARWSSCAVLVRTNALLEPLLRGLRAAGIPARVRGAAAALEEPAVRALVRQVQDPAGQGTLRELVEVVESVLAVDRDDPHPVEPPAPSAAFAALLALAWEHLEDEPAASLAAFRTRLAGGGPGDDAGGRDAVTLATFHASKGLEWPVVVVAGLEDGLVPHASASTAEARAEEVRLLYVALTRAERALLCTWAERRGASRRKRRPSPLLEAVAQSMAPATPAPPPPQLRRRAVAPADPVLEALRAWRAAAAAAAKIPERAVCDDATLAAVARARPASAEDLAPLLGPLAAARLGPRMVQVVAAATAGPAAGVSAAAEAAATPRA